MNNHSEAFPYAVKKSPTAHHHFVAFLYHIINCLKNNPSFPNTAPTVALLANTADGLAAANTRARNGSVADTADRNARRDDAEDLVDLLVICVRATVRAQATDPATAAAMIRSSGFSMRKKYSSQKPPLAAKQGAVPGEVLLEARAVAKGANYWWEYSLDQTDWKSLGLTMRADTTLTGLAPGRTYFFRFRAQTRKGLGDYSQVIRLQVH